MKELILALNATVDGQTTAHYITELLHEAGVKVTRLAHGVPVGGELDYLDEGTLSAAIKQRTTVLMRRLACIAAAALALMPAAAFADEKYLPLSVIAAGLKQADCDIRPRKSPSRSAGSRRRAQAGPGLLLASGL